MNEFLLKAGDTLRHLVESQDGQDLVEYSLVVALIAFCAVAGMSTLASDINAVFVGLGSELTSVTA